MKDIESRIHETDQDSGYFIVADKVWGKKDKFVNYYMVQSFANDDWFLVDGGLKWSSSNIIEMAADLFGAGHLPKGIFLTHGHFDHSGSLPELLHHWDVPVYAHELELPYLTNQSAYPPADPEVGGGIMSALSFMFPQGPINISSNVRKLPGDGSIPGFSEWRYINTPGHSPGHVSLFREHDSVLLAGDAFLTTKAESAYHAFTYKESVSGPPKYFTYDWGLAKESVEKLCALSPSVAATGHGNPITSPQLAFELNNLLNNFDVIAVPEFGRYVNEPAIVNKFGLASCPQRTGLMPIIKKVVAYSSLLLSACVIAYRWKRS
ncbi:MAG: MBL fold metallo-hydrolase [Chryseolinea sp.]